jgi:putative transposase
MNRTVRLLLEPTEEQAESLKLTIEQFTACFNEVCKVGWQSNQNNGVNLHHATYKSLKGNYPDLVSDLIIQARVKAVEALASAFTLRKNGRKVNQPQSILCPARYNDHTFRINWKENIVNLSSVSGRLKIPFTVPGYAVKYLGYPTATADLIYRKGKLWLNLVIDIPTPEIEQSAEVVGVDLGINRPAVMSNNKFLGERHWKEPEQRTFRLKRKLQRKGTKAAKRHLKKLAGKQLRRRRDHDHVLSKRIVENSPVGGTIAFENLKNIRKNAKQRKGRQQRKLHCWSFAQLSAFTEYKAEERGIKVVFVDPRNTSKACSGCGHIHKANRRSQSVFKCKKCGYELNADLNGSRNVRQTYLASVGKSDAGAPQSLGVLQSVSSC